MAITLGTFTQLDDGVLTGTFKTLNVTASLVIVPIDKTSDKAPDHRVYAGPRHEVGAGWSQVAKSSGETYINLKIGSPEFGPNWVRCPPRQARQAGRRRRHPHRPLGTARLASTIAPPRDPRRGFFAQPPL
jgi:uncharacterized protein (DUF736 family)